jgi:thiamine biosynthesis lipoprotein
MELAVSSLPMTSFSKNPVIKRAQPWLGTLVTIRVEGIRVSRAHRAIDAAFAEVATVHRLMSFHREESDVSRLNRWAVHGPVAVHPYTFEVLQWALKLSSRSGGCFDISVGAQLVAWQFLPRPPGGPCDPRASWRDIELRLEGHVVFHRPLWIDLGGIAKGYAVDRASEILRSWGAHRSTVNAGGDIRVNGKRAERIALDIGSPADVLPILELREGSVASSTGQRHRRRHRGHLLGPHVHGVLRSPLPTDRFVCVVAGRCVVADSLTKVALAEGANSKKLLQQFGASAHVYDAQRGWEHLGARMGDS